MPDPEAIVRFVKRPYTQALLRCLTRKRRGGQCLLDEIFEWYGRDDISLMNRLRFAVPFLFIDYVRRRAGASGSKIDAN